MLVSYKLPRHLVDALRKEAAQRGVTATDFVGELVAGELQIAYMDQETLPLLRAL